MRFHRLTPKETGKAIAVGFVTALLLSAIMLPAFRAGISPLPKPLGLAFAQTLLGANVPLAVGLLFHVAWTTFWGAAYVVVFRNTLAFMQAFWLAMALAALVAVFFYPFVGWGFFGVAASRLAIAVDVVLHLLFAFFVWALSHLFFRREIRGHGLRTA